MANAYILVMFGILVAKGVGFLRDMALSALFGASATSDIYYQVFGVASLVFTAVGSALSTLIIKNINKTEHSSPDAQRSYAAYFIRSISLLIIIVMALLYAFARPISMLLLPGRSGADYDLAVKLMYIMLPSFLFIAVAYMMSGLLQNRRKFFLPSIMSLPYNLLAVIAVYMGVSGVETISIITTLGWFLHIVILMPPFYKEGYRFFAPKRGIDTSGGVKNVAETVYIFISGMMFQLCFLIDRTFVGGEAGVTTTLTYASQLFITFSGVFVVALSSVVFPAISQNYEHGEMKYVRELIGYIIKIMMSIFVFYLIAVVFFGEDIIALLYERGNFTHDVTERVSTAFVIYSFGIFGYLAQNLLNKVLYISGRYKMTVIGTIVTVALKIALDVFAVPRFGANAAAVTTTLLLTLYAIYVAICLHGVIGSFLSKELGFSVLKILLCAAVSVVSLILSLNFIDTAALPDKIEFLVPLFIACGVYAIAMFLSGVLKDLFSTPLSKNR
ncbi:MAG: polysaccharide biosynthesis C-terminal domain-containing protein [Clostridia bacterium]|nr:polysaccharide biosynthesis C-terminal domain-containing protein [Clostridia bacterium]